MRAVRTAGAPHRPAFPSAAAPRLRCALTPPPSTPRLSLPSHRLSTATPPPPSPATPPSPASSSVPAKKPAAKWVPSPSTEHIVANFGPPPPTTGQVARASKTHVSLRASDGTLLWEVPWTGVHSILMVVDGAARAKYWVLYERDTMAVRKLSLALPDAAEFAAQLRRRPGWLRENEARALATATDEAAKRGGLLSFLCWSDLKAHFLRKYGPPPPPVVRSKRARSLFKRLGRPLPEPDAIAAPAKPAKPAKPSAKAAAAAPAPDTPTP